MRNQSENDPEHESIGQTLDRYSAQVESLNQQLELYEQYMVRAAKILSHRLSGHDNNNLAAEIYMVLDGINPEDGP